MAISLTTTEGRDAILKTFKDVWDVTGYLAQYDGTAGEPPNQTDPWARVIVRHVTGGSATLGNVQGKRSFLRIGTVTIQMFDKANRDGLSELDVLANAVLRGYEKPSDPCHGVWYRNARLNEVGQNGDWTQFNVIAEFSYHEVH